MVDHGNDWGAAEMVGVLMLIALFVVVIAVVAVTWFSNPPPEKNPAVNLQITNETRLIRINHAGGDPLYTDRLTIYVDGVPRTFEGFGNDNIWMTGETIQYTVPNSELVPYKVDVVYSDSPSRGTRSALIAQLLLGNLTTVRPEGVYHTISAVVENVGGSISPYGSYYAPDGASATFTITNSSTYKIFELKDNGTVQVAVAGGTPTIHTYSLSDIRTDHTISVKFESLSSTTSGMYYINATNTSGGEITPKGLVAVANNGSQTFTLTAYPPDNIIMALMVDNASLGSVGSHTFPDVYTNHSIHASFGSQYLPGIIGTYYKDRQWSLPGRTKEHPRIQFANAMAVRDSGASTDANDWPAAPDYISQTKNFSVNYSGLLHIEVADTYRFHVTGCNGYFLRINDQTLLNNLGNPVTGSRAFITPTSRSSSAVSLSPGYYNFIALMWVSNTTDEEGAIAVYYTNTSTGGTQTLITNFNHTPFNQPIADFSGAPLTGTVPHTVKFTDSSAFATTWTWNFGDGSALSYEQNPSHTYTVPGKYTVTQIATNSFGSDTKVRSDYITVAESGSCVDGLNAVYYANTSWADPGRTRTDARIWFSDLYPGYESDPTDDTNWPTSILPSKEFFSVFWDGYMYIPTSDTYTFRLTSDDGAFLWIDSDPSSASPTIDNGGLHPSYQKTGDILLDSGWHSFAVKMYENEERAVIYLEYHNSTYLTYQSVSHVCHIQLPPVAAFTGTPTTGSSPLAVTFTDQSANSPTSWLWDFGDGTTSTFQNPSHPYTNPGSYTVTLTATNTVGSSTLSKEDYITAAHPSYTRRVNAGGNSYTDTSGNTWSADQQYSSGGWGYVSEGSTSTTSNAISGTTDDTLYQSMRRRNTLEYRFTVPNGDYDVTLKFAEIQNTVGSGDRVFDVDIESTRVMNDADIYSLAGGRYRAYDQTFPTTVSDGVLNILFTRAGGWSDPAMVSAIGLDLDVPVPVAAFTATPTSGESPLTVAFTDESTNVPTSWLWDFGDGNTTGNTLKNPVHLYQSDGTYTVTLTASNAGGSNTVTRTSYILAGPQAPVAGFTGTPVTGNVPLSVVFTDTSANTPTSWSWNFGDTSTSTSQHPTHVYATPGTYTVTLIATNALGSGTETKAGYITATTPPVVTGISPTTGSSAGGTTVTITGEHLAGATAVMFGTNAGTILTNTDTQITATSPAHSAGPVHVTVVTAGGISATSAADLFTYYTIQTFTSSTIWTVPSGVTNVEYLVVGGGGGGGSYGGGGGAGGFRTGTLTGLSGDQTVTVGSGGAGGIDWWWGTPATDGGDSAFGTITVSGGGGGGSSFSTNGLSGGSGGGATGTGTAGSGTPGQGNIGGTGKQWGTRYMGGGGGGASAAGGAATGTSAPYTGGSGGAGSYSAITGTDTPYAGGGGGGGSSNGGSLPGGGGVGGGGAGTVGNNDGGDATYYGGGGGGGGSGGNGGAGYQGIVIIKYS